jgi:hypothetical protein
MELALEKYLELDRNDFTRPSLHVDCSAETDRTHAPSASSLRQQKSCRLILRMRDF